MPLVLRTQFDMARSSVQIRVGAFLFAFFVILETMEGPPGWGRPLAPTAFHPAGPRRQPALDESGLWKVRWLFGAISNVVGEAAVLTGEKYKRRKANSNHCLSSTLDVSIPPLSALQPNPQVRHPPLGAATTSEYMYGWPIPSHRMAWFSTDAQLDPARWLGPAISPHAFHPPIGESRHSLVPRSDANTRSSPGRFHRRTRRRAMDDASPACPAARAGLVGLPCDAKRGMSRLCM